MPPEELRGGVGSGSQRQAEAAGRVERCGRHRRSCGEGKRRLITTHQEVSRFLSLRGRGYRGNDPGSSR